MFIKNCIASVDKNPLTLFRIEALFKGDGCLFKIPSTPYQLMSEAVVNLEINSWAYRCFFL